MKKNSLIVLAVVLTLSTMGGYASVYARGYGGPFSGGCDGGPHRGELLLGLSLEQEMLFHRTMREVRQEKAVLRARAAEVRKELKEVLAAQDFDEDLFRKKSALLAEIRGKMAVLVDEAVISLAQKLGPEEREILGKLIRPKFSGDRGPRGRWR